MEGIPNLTNFKKRHEEIDKLMLAPDFYQDQRRAAALGREHQKLGELIESHQALAKLYESIEESKALINDPDSDPELVELAKEELKELQENEPEMRKSFLVAMIPPDESDSRNTVMEIRAGTGGDEASLFSADLYRMYTRFAEEKGWRIELMSSSPSECGGLREVIFLISGEEVFKNLKYESGVHRVQRVPTTEASGRIHTSTSTVAVLPEAEEVDIRINPDDLDISVCRASGPGGQGVNTTDSAVQILHKPTGLIVTCADERSQTKNKAKAMTVLRSRLLKKKQEEEREKYDSQRRSQIGSGERSERIRTYNFPQNRLTDHRIGLTLYSLTEVLEGSIQELIAALQKADKEDRVASLLEENAEVKA